MSLGFEMASAKTQLTVGGMGCLLLHVAWSNETTGGTINNIKEVFIFKRQTQGGPVSYVALGAMSL